MTIRTSTLKPNTTTPRAAAPAVVSPEAAAEVEGGLPHQVAQTNTRRAPEPTAKTPPAAKLPAPGPRHGKPVPEPALRAATQTAVEVVLDGGDTYRMLGLVSAMALEQRVSTADVLGAMKRVVDAWGHLAAPETVDLP